MQSDSNEGCCFQNITATKVLKVDHLNVLATLSHPQISLGQLKTRPGKVGF